MKLTFTIEKTQGKARAATVRLPRGSFQTPLFMPVGTMATVKALTPEELHQLNAPVILSNSYHLYLRPGVEIIQRCGGLHRFMGWNGLILTDSGGYQIFSLRSLMNIDDQGVAFRSHVDGSAHELSPEQVMAVQAGLGSDIAMVFDHCPPSEAPRAEIAKALERTTLWAERCIRQPRPEHQVRFGIIQGGLELDLRLSHIEALSAFPFEGFALGGLSVGETPQQMHYVLEHVASRMPADKPRYLMGVGRPQDLLVAIGEGIDMFDCVMPTRNARNGQLFTHSGPIAISNARFRDDTGPIDTRCGCPVCRTYCRAYLRHLYASKEILYHRLGTLHNVHFVLELVRQARTAILEQRYPHFMKEVLAELEG